MTSISGTHKKTEAVVAQFCLSILLVIWEENTELLRKSNHGPDTLEMELAS